MISGPLMAILFQLLGWGSLILEIFGLIVCIRYLRLSTAMPLLVLAFAGYVGGGLIYQMLSLAVGLNALPATMLSTVGVLNYSVHVGATALLVFGLWLVFRDVRERFQFLREAHESGRERASPVNATRE